MSKELKAALSALSKPPLTPEKIHKTFEKVWKL